VPSPATPSPVICPECGTPAGIATRIEARRQRIYLGLPRLLTAAIALTLLAVSIFFPHASKQTSYATFWMPTRGAEFSPATLQSIAKQGGDGSLVRAILEGPPRSWQPSPDWHPCEPQLTTYVQPKSGVVYANRRFGWPREWFFVETHAAYLDPDARTGPTPHDWGTVSMDWWTGSRTYFSNGGPVTPANRRWELEPAGIAVALLILLVSGFLARSLARRRTRTSAQAQRRFTPARSFALGVLIALAALLAVSLLTSEASSHIRRDALNTGWKSPTAKWAENFALTRADIAPLATNPAGEAELAEQILGALPAGSLEGSVVTAYLTCQCQQPAESVRYYGFPPFAGSVVFISERDQPHWALGDKPWTLSWQNASLTCRWSRSGSWTTTDATVHFPAFAFHILLYLILFFTIKSICYFLLARRAANRAAKGLCQRCAYPLPNAVT
jgi:hypothetical protein